MAKAPNIKLNNGLTMPAMGLGTWLSKPGEVGRAIKLAIDAGYRHFDCAYLYQNEKEIGAAIREKIQDGSVKREELFIVSKCWNTYQHPDLVMKACKKTLKNFGLDYIDLYLLHWPMAFKPTERIDIESRELDDWSVITNDPEFWPRDAQGNILFDDTDFVDSWKEMEKCVQLGLTKSIGVSNYTPAQIERLMKSAKIKPVNNQVEAHLYLNQKKLISVCQQHGIVVTAYCPLGSPGSPYLSPDFPRVLENPKLAQIAKSHNKTPGQVALRYLFEIGAYPLPKSTNPGRIVENISIFDFKLTPQELAALDTLDCNGRTVLMLGTEHHKEYPF